jgi:hypothetical protein
MTEIGPVQMMVLTFGPDADFEGRIIDELTRLQGERTIRVLDLLFMLKDRDSGELVTVDHKGEELGTIVAAILGVDGPQADRQVADEGAGPSAFGLTQQEIREVAESLEPGHSVGFVMIEHVWARDLKRAIRDAGGTPVSEAFLTPEMVAAVEPELAAAAGAHGSSD